MCGIWAAFGISKVQDHYTGPFNKISHRGPDAWRVEYVKGIKNSVVGFHHLEIVDGTYGMQPMKLHQYPHTVLVCNGEIYNFKNLGEQFNFGYETHSDVECIVHLYQHYGIEECIKNLDGVFAFCIVDILKQKVFLGRDPYGIRPLFKLCSKSGVLAISSEAKAIVPLIKQLNGEEYDLKPFLPGTFEEYDLLDDGKVRSVQSKTFYNLGSRPSFKPFLPYEELTDDHLFNIRTLLTMAVRKRLMAYRRIGCMLSGGLDSSLVASILVQEAKRVNLPYKIQSFTVGTEDSPDIAAARDVAKYIGTEHHEIILTEDKCAEILDAVIYHLETPDVLMIREAVGQYLISKYICETTDTTVIFSGEGSDELWQGYIHFRNAPSAEEAHNESIRLLEQLYLYDGLRADRSTAAHSLELRVPFLDLQFNNYILSLPKELRQPKNMKVEKYLLRSAFEGTDLLPPHILWREKEEFSKGVAPEKKPLCTILDPIIEKRLPDSFDFKLAQKKYPYCTPKNKEALYYREIFENKFPKLAEKFRPFDWTPKWIDKEDIAAKYY